MAIHLPVEEFLAALGPQEFANEVQLQQFFEDSLAPLCGLRLVSSSLRGRNRLGYIDSTALDDDGTAVIVEYKLDRVDSDVMQQLFRYKQWFLSHQDLFDVEALSKWNQRTSRVTPPRLIAVGYRFHQIPVVEAHHPVLFLRYGYRSDKTVTLRALDVEEVKTASLGPKPPPFSKDGYLDVHLATTTPAAREAFQMLRRQLVSAGLAERIHGKNRVSYQKNGRATVDVSFTPIAVQCFFDAPEPLKDAIGRVRPSQTHRAWTCGIASPDDVEYFLRLVGL